MLAVDLAKEPWHAHPPLAADLEGTREPAGFCKAICRRLADPELLGRPADALDVQGQRRHRVQHRRGVQLARLVDGGTLLESDWWPWTAVTAPL